MDAVYRKWFDADTVQVKIEVENPDNFLTVREVVELTGAPKNSKVLVRREESAIAFIISNDIFDEDMYRYLVNETDGLSLYLKNAVMVLKEPFTNQGIGPRCVIKEIFAAKNLSDELPIVSIKVDATGNYDAFHWIKHPLRGYYVWACMGFDGKIPGKVIKQLPARYHHCAHVSELMQEDGGREQWLRHGDTVQLAFDLTPDSISWRLLLEYMTVKGVEL